MIPAAGAAAWFGGWPYLVLVAIAVALLAIEWGGMSAPVSPTRVAAAVAAGVLVAVFLGYRGHYLWAWGSIAMMAVAAAVIARGVAERPTDAAFGVLYLAPAALCLVWLRDTNQGAWWTMMLFATTWAADKSMSPLTERVNDFETPSCMKLLSKDRECWWWSPVWVD